MWIFFFQLGKLCGLASTYLHGRVPEGPGTAGDPSDMGPGNSLAFPSGPAVGQHYLHNMMTFISVFLEGDLWK